MSLTIDYIAMPPKSQEVSQIQTGEQTRISQEQQEIAMQFQNEVKQQSETTVRRRDVNNDELKNDERKNNKKKKKKAVLKKDEGDDVQEENKEKNAINPLSGRRFDIRV